MSIWKKTLLFIAGGVSYVGLELLWRGRSHSSMFFAGGSCFLLLGSIQRRLRRCPQAICAAAGAGIITAVELVTGLLVNRQYAVWDYRQMPLNFFGQICLPFSLLWYPVSAGAMLLYGALERKLS